MDKKTTGSSSKSTKDNKNGGFLKKFKRKPLWYRVFMITSAVIIVILLGMIAYAYRLMSLVNYDNGENNVNNPSSTEYFETVENPEDYTNLPVASIDTPTHKGEGRSETGVYNILLLGLDKDSGNLSDSMIVVTIDTNTKALKLTSFMRDMLVTIPGYSNNKLNTVYRTGGIDLLKEVFAKHFDLCIDGYVAVNFSSLTKVIDKLGGVSVYLTEAEAEFLNTSNYIADPQYRNLQVYTGTHWLNGAQATGYARIRFVDKGSEADDYARTSRQRQILNAIYDQFKNQSLTELLSLMESVLPLVTTDFTVMEMT
ncbi:MAG: LCP family protein, partial [Lachnospiraceae bacterium]|nr:LCP family protein [Lachnospiraceae bacterium]